MKVLLVFLAVTMMAQAVDFRVEKLDNGLTVVVSRDASSPVVTVCIAVKTGATCETPETNGLAHFYEHMFFKGNAALPSQTAYNRRMGELGIVRNGTTSSEMVRYYVTLGSGKLEEGLRFMYDAITSPLFDSLEMEREREVILNEYQRGLVSPFHPYVEAMEKVIFSSAPWRYSAIGDPEVIMAADPEVMREFRHKYYTPDNSVLIIAGDVDCDRVFQLASEIFSGWEYGGRSDYDSLPRLVRIERDTTVLVDSPSGIGYVAVVFEGPSISTDPSDSYPADVWGEYLSLTSGRFYTDLVTNGPFTDVSAWYYTQRFAPTVTFGGRVPAERAMEALEALRDEIRELQDPGYYDPEEMRLAKERLRRDRILSGETARDVAVESLSFWWVVAGNLDYYATYLDSIRAVEIDDVTAFVRRWITGKPSAAFVMMPLEGSMEP